MKGKTFCIFKGIALFAIISMFFLSAMPKINFVAPAAVEHAATIFEDDFESYIVDTVPYVGEWNYDSPQKWGDFACIDDDSAELVIGIKRMPNSYAKLMDLTTRHGGKLVNKVSMGGEIWAVVVDVPFESVYRVVEEAKIMKGLARYIEPNMKFYVDFFPNDPYWSQQWGPKKIEADWAWNTTIGDPSVLVAVIDTGIDWNHPDLVANYVSLGYDWVNNDPNPMDDHGHGTHCAGIIAATLNNSVGISGIAQVKIMAEKGLDASGCGWDDDLANAIIHAVDQGADILSNSWGGGKSELIHDAMKYAYDRGVLVIAAAGNEATSSKSYPAGYDEVVAVAATNDADNPASFTNFGDWIEVAAPGVNIYSTVWDDSYISKSGTSMACPHVAGVAALIWSRFPAMTRDQVRIHLWYSADDLGAPGFDIRYGFGRVNARSAVEKTLPEHDLLLRDWDLIPYLRPNSTATIHTTVINFGTHNESDIAVQLLVNGSLIDSASIGYLASGSSETVSCSWTPTVIGMYNVTSYVVPVAGETIIDNNMRSCYVLVHPTIIFRDNFESYAVGSFPSAGGWELAFNGAGDQYQVVVDSVSKSPTKSLQLLGAPNWAADAVVPVSTRAPKIGFEVYVRVDETRGGSEDNARIGFWKRVSSNIARWYTTVSFYDDGTIRSGGQVLQSYVADTWYKVKLVFDRENNTYSVWIDDMLRGENLDGPTNPYALEAFALSGRYNGIKEHYDDVEIFAEGTPVSTIPFWDDFEGYAVGSFPSAGGWELAFNGAGDQYQVVVDSVSVSPTKSLRLLGAPNWAADAVRPIFSEAKVIGFEVCVRVDETRGGSGDNARVGFWKKTSSSTAKWYTSVHFYDDGIIRSGGQVLQSYVADTWYKVKLVLDRENSTYSVWIDDVLRGENLTGPSDPYVMEAFAVSSTMYNSVKAYFDDVKVFEGEALPPLGPTARFSYSPRYPRPNDTITFDASASVAGWNGTHEVPIANYTWDFGDGNIRTVRDNVIHYIYEAEGNYTVSLTVMCQDDPVLIAEGLTSDSTWKKITVKIRPPFSFEDDFEGYAVGSFPSAGGWELAFNGAGNQYQVVVDSVSRSPTKSLQLLGAPSWAADAVKPFSSEATMIGFEVCVRVDETRGGSGDNARVGFWKKTSSSTAKWYTSVHFYDDGQIRSGGQVLQSYVADTWYKVKLVYDREKNTYSVWIDDILRGEGLAGPSDPYVMEAFAVSSTMYNSVKAYFDDVKLFELPPPQHDVAVVSITPSEAVVGAGCSIDIDVVAENQGGYTETFNVTLYYDDVIIGVQTVSSLAPGASITLTFNWNTTSLSPGNYTLKAEADMVMGETDTSDNTYINGTVTVIQAQFTSSTLYAVNLYVNGPFVNGTSLKAKFYSYSGVYQAEITLWTATTPAPIELSIQVPHPLDLPVEIVVLVLTDEAGDAISTITTFTMCNSQLTKRLAQLDYLWTVPDEDRAAIMKEIVAIDGQWPYAPRNPISNL